MDSYQVNHGHLNKHDADHGSGQRADMPDLTLEVLGGGSENPINEVTLRVTAGVVNTGGSEFIDRLTFDGLPAGVELIGAPGGIIDEPGTPNTLTAEVILVLPPNQDTSFDLSVGAVSIEPSSGDETKTTANIAIAVDANTNSFTDNFEAQDQSIWGPGAEFVFRDNRFIGLAGNISRSIDIGPLEGDFSLVFRAGFQSDLVFEGGSIDVQLPFEINVDTSFNRTTDTLQIAPASATLLPGGGFQTEGPEGNFALDFIFNYALSAELGLDFPTRFFDVEFFDFTRSRNAPPTRVLDLSSDDLSQTIPLPLGLSGTVTWPTINTTSEVSDTNEFSSSGQSADFLQLTLDVDQALADIFLGGANPFHAEARVNTRLVSAAARLEALDFDLIGGVGFLQDFTMEVNGINGSIIFETGSAQNFDFVSPLVIRNASALDVNGDGAIEFRLTISPDVIVNNSTSLGFNVGYELDLYQLNVSYRTGSIDTIFGEIGPFRGSFSVGPLVQQRDTFPIADVEVFDNAFVLDFQPQEVMFVA
jgi:hypothetical protein